MSREYVCKIKVSIPESATEEDAKAIKNLSISCLQYGLAGILLLKPIDEKVMMEEVTRFRDRYLSKLPDVDWSDPVKVVTVGMAGMFGAYPSLEAADSMIVVTPGSLQIKYWARNVIPDGWLDYVIMRFPHWCCRVDYVEYESCEGYIEYRDGRFTSKSAEFPEEGKQCRFANLVVE